MIIGINGNIGSGKDLVGKIIRNLTRPVTWNYVKIEEGEINPMPLPSSWVIKKFAAKLKQIASLLTGIPVEKFEDQEFKKSYLPDIWNEDIPEMKRVKARMTVREFLQKLGTEAIRDKLHKNTWVNALFTDYKLKVGQWDNIAIRDSWPNWIITDTRFPNEAQAIKDRRGLVIRVNRNLEQVDYQTLEQRHPSETSLDNWNFDYIIDNNGTKEELIEKVGVFLKQFNLLDNGTIQQENNSSGKPEESTKEENPQKGEG